MPDQISQDLVPIGIEVARARFGGVEASAHSIFSVARLDHCRAHRGAPDALSRTRDQEIGFLTDILVLGLDMEFGDIDDE